MGNNFLITKRDRTLKALQMTQVDALKELDRICRKHDIKYSLGGGTCLGLIRHGGFIPWDDDIDVDMTLDNYEKFLNVAQKELNTDRFFLRCRGTDSSHLRSNSRIEVKGTTLGQVQWDRNGLDVGVFIDIFGWCYLPDNRILRKLVTTCLFYCYVIENYKMFELYARKANPKVKALVRILGTIVPVKALYWFENKLKHSCGDKKTGWIIDDAIINGNHGGYRSDGLDEYEDVTFEGITVMNKKNPHNFLKVLYGEKYGEWLPPKKRISHHRWTKFDLGEYAEKYGLEPDYEDNFVTKYSKEKLMQMQKVSLDLMRLVDDICTENNLRYYVVGYDAYIKGKDRNEYGRFWRNPSRIAMPLEDYDKMESICKESFSEKYDFISWNTYDSFRYSHSRIVLNYTALAESKVPAREREKFNTGFYIEIIPLVNTSGENEKRNVHEKQIRKLNDSIILKWRHTDFARRKNDSWKRKLMGYKLLFKSFDSLKKEVESEWIRYKDNQNDFYADGTGYRLPAAVIPKDIFGNGVRMDYNGYSLVFPEKVEKFAELQDKKIRNSSKDKLYLYKRCFEELDEEQIDAIQRQYAWCSLTYFDSPDNQLSVLRYDEKNNVFLSNEELFKLDKNMTNSGETYWQR